MKIFNKTVSTNEVIPYTLLAVYTLVMAFLMVYVGDWTIGDDVLYLNTTAIGKFNWCLDGFIPATGRLFPLAHFDYNLTLLFPFIPTAKAHYLLNAISFCIYVALLWYMIKQAVYAVDIANVNNDKKSRYIPMVIFFGLMFLAFPRKMFLIALVIYALLYLCSRWIKDAAYRPWIVTIAVLSILLQPMWGIDFFELHTATRIFVVLTALFMWAAYRFINTQSWKYALITLFSALYLIYSYEYHFGLFVTFAAVMLIFYPQQTKLFKGVMWGIIGIAMSYVMIYMICIYPYIENMYSHGKQSAAIGIPNLMSWVKIYSFAIAIALYRAYDVLWKKDREHVLLDSFLLSGLAGMCALIVLDIYDPYSHMTNIVLCYIPVVYWMQKLCGSKCSLVLYALIAVSLIPVFKKVLKERVANMSDTMPKVEAVVHQLQPDTKLIMIMPDDPETMVMYMTRQMGCDMFIERFEAIIRYGNQAHKSYKIEQCVVDDISTIDDNNIYITNTEWIADRNIQERLDSMSLKVPFKTDIEGAIFTVYKK